MGDFFKKLWQNKRTRYSLLATLPGPIILIFLFLPSYLLPTKHLEQGFKQDIENAFGLMPSISSSKLRLVPPEFIIKDVVIRQKDANAKGLTLAKADLVKMTFSFWSYLKGDLNVDLVVEDAIFHVRKPVPWFELINFSKPAKVNEDSYQLNSIHFVNSELHFLSQNHGQQAHIIDKVDFFANLIHDETIALNIKAKASLLYAQKMEIACKGVVDLDQGLDRIQTKQFKFSLGATNFNLDGWLNYKDNNQSYKLNLATAEVDLVSVLDFYSLDGFELPKDFQLIGPMALDVNLQKQDENMQVKVHADATASQIRWPGFFTKPKDTPFKLVLNADNLSDQFVINQLSLFLANSVFELKGLFTKNDQQQIELRLEPVEFSKISLADYFPVLSFIKNVQTARAELEIKAALKQTGTTKLHARLQAEQAQVLGQDVKNLETILDYADEQIILNPFRAELYNGALSGNININLAAKQPSFESEFVVDDLDVSKILPFLTGTGSLVAKGESSGQSVSELWKNMQGGGSIVLAKGKLNKLNSLANLDADRFGKLSNEIKDLRATFNYDQEQLTISKIKWNFGKYKAEAKFAKANKAVKGQAIIAGAGIEKKARIEGEIKELLFNKPTAKLKRSKGLGLKSLPVEDLKPMRKQFAQPEETPKPKAKPKSTKIKRRKRKKPPKKKMMEEDLFKVIIGG